MRITVGRKIGENIVEFKMRNSSDIMELDVKEAIDLVKKVIKSQDFPNE